MAGCKATATLSSNAHSDDTDSNDTNCIVTWRRQRQQLQHNLQQTASRSLDSMSDRELDQRLGRLCNDLMDYLSTGHGSVYARYYCMNRLQHPASGERSRLLQDIWLNLGRTTDAALRFNQRCETTPMAALQQKLHAELGKLNKMLSLRFALEEQLLALAEHGPSIRGG